MGTQARTLTVDRSRFIAVTRWSGEIFGMSFTITLSPIPLGFSLHSCMTRSSRSTASTASCFITTSATAMLAEVPTEGSWARVVLLCNHAVVKRLVATPSLDIAREIGECSHGRGSFARICQSNVWIAAIWTEHGWRVVFRDLGDRCVCRDSLWSWKWSALSARRMQRDAVACRCRLAQHSPGTHPESSPRGCFDIRKDVLPSWWAGNTSTCR